ARLFAIVGQLFCAWRFHRVKICRFCRILRIRVLPSGRRLLEQCFKNNGMLRMIMGVSSGVGAGANFLKP
ncbi:MAG: hypothetical protein L3J26_10025, partial [Candidatus Polarisedimenticolaceae bacterium]|nr:hypothetical protein [Candidatus Polarisedimenticolaceae bacterium]